MKKVVVKSILSYDFIKEMDFLGTKSSSDLGFISTSPPYLIIFYCLLGNIVILSLCNSSILLHFGHFSSYLLIISLGDLRILPS